jgi:ribonuclease J
MLKIIPLGGLGEIGLNMMLFEYEETIIVVDAGLMFPEDYMLGIDYVIPEMEYLKANSAKVAAVIITHAHEDHIGALPYLLKDVRAPVYGTPFTLGMIKHKLMEFGLPYLVPLEKISTADKVRFGPFELEFIRVSHSVVDGVGLAVRTPVGLIVHSGDFKLSHSPVDGMMTDVNKFAQCGAEGVLALMSDSTNVEREGYTISDKEVGSTLARIARESQGRIIVALFASNIGRIQQIVDIAKEMNRRIIFNGRSIEVSATLAKELGYLHVPDGMEADIDEVNDYPDDEIAIVTTGSQGEPLSALARMSSGSHKQIKIREGDMVILSSKFIPGNERAITNIINNLYRQGADVIYEKISEIHVSGHAFREELKLMINMTKPRFFIPIHGEYRHLTLHARLAQDVGIAKENILIAENGQTIAFDENGGRLRDTIVTGRILVDGKGIGDVGRSVLKDRRVLSEDGLVVVTIVFDEETGYIMYGPEIVSRGFVFETETGHLLEDSKCVILEVIEETHPDTLNRIEKIRSKIQTNLRKYFYFAIRRRPIVIPIILEI